MQRTYRVLPTTSTEVCKGINTNKQTPNKLTNEQTSASPKFPNNDTSIPLIREKENYWMKFYEYI